MKVDQNVLATVYWIIILTVTIINHTFVVNRAGIIICMPFVVIYL